MLDEQQLNTLKSLVNAIIPADDWPSGWQAGVGDYLLRQFKRDLTEAAATYAQWLTSLDAESRASCQRPFAELSLAERTRLLEAIEQGQIKTAWPIDAAAFFQQIVEHCIEGFYSDPGNGGNKNGVAWDMIGFEVRG